METKHKSRRRYDREFKENAVALYKSSGKTLREVARDLGTTSWSLSNWCRGHNLGQEQTEPKTLSAETPEQREIRRLRGDLEHMTRQRDILKKAVGILSAEVPPNTLR